MPVVVYAAALMLMAAQAVAHAGAVASAPARFAAIGAALFVASDSLLAVNRFSARIPNEQVWIMGTYVPAQVLIALSVQP